MTPERWSSIENVFSRACVLTGRAREEILSECTDEALEKEIRQLLRNFDEAGNFLSALPPEVEELQQAEDAVFSPGDHILSRFRVVRRLGSGGMGEVYEVHDYTVGENLALKTLRPARAADARAVRALRDELRRARRVTHENVCRLHELFETQSGNGEPLTFLTMELLRGHTLADLLARDGPMEGAEALRLLKQIAAGLEAAHSAGILHRDLKPGNVFVLGEDANRRVLITDFGMAYPLEDRSDSRGSASGIPAVGGTPGYMAPEQYLPGRLTPSVDVYALGVMTHEMLFGCRPAQAGGPPLPALEHRERWLAAIAKATDADAARRYRTPSEFVAACGPQLRSPRRIFIGAALGAAAVGGGFFLIPASRNSPIRVAVMPFSAATEADEQWADGATESLSRVLRTNPSLEVMGRDSAARFSGSRAGVPNLNVDWLIGGSVGRSGDEIQMHVELVRLPGNAVFWSTTERGRISAFSAFSVQIVQQIGRQISASLAQFGPGAPAQETNAGALDHYLKGRVHWNRRAGDQLVKAREEFRASMAADPRFVPAYCGLADVLSTLADYHFEPPSVILPQAKQAAVTALGLNSQLPDCHVSFAHATALNDGDWATADLSFRRAIALDNRHPLARQWYAILLMKLGRAEECIAQSREVVRMDPLSVSAQRSLCVMLYFTRRYREAVAASAKVFEMAPGYFGLQELLGECYARLGDPRSAQQQCDASLARQQTPGLASTYAAVAYAILGMRDKAEALISALTANPGAIRFQPTHVARAWAELREMDRAFEWLERAYAERDTMLQMLPTHASFDLLRLDPRYKPLLARLRFTYPQQG